MTGWRESHGGDVTVVMLMWVGCARVCFGDGCVREGRGRGEKLHCYVCYGLRAFPDGEGERL